MGKRKKSSRKPGAGRKKLEPLDVTFNCLFCNGKKAVTCRMEKVQAVATLSCKQCGTKWACPIQQLDEPIDVYSAWIDACDEVAKGQFSQAGTRAS